MAVMAAWFQRRRKKGQGSQGGERSTVAQDDLRGVNSVPRDLWPAPSHLHPDPGYQIFGETISTLWTSYINLLTFLYLLVKCN
jgi:hypothetical protein